MEVTATALKWSFKSGIDQGTTVVHRMTGVLYENPAFGARLFFAGDELRGIVFVERQGAQGNTLTLKPKGEALLGLADDDRYFVEYTHTFMSVGQDPFTADISGEYALEIVRCFAEAASSE